MTVEEVGNAENYACFAMNKDVVPLPDLFQLVFTGSTPFVDSDGWVWFQGYYNNVLMKVLFDGTQTTSSKGVTSSSLVVVGDWVYFREPVTDRLSRMKTDGTAIENIGGAQTLSAPFVTSDGWVWFVGLLPRYERRPVAYEDRRDGPEPHWRQLQRVLHEVDSILLQRVCVLPGYEWRTLEVVSRCIAIAAGRVGGLDEAARHSRTS
jgi:hypothetical protein